MRLLARLYRFFATVVVLVIGVPWLIGTFLFFLACSLAGGFLLFSMLRGLFAGTEMLDDLPSTALGVLGFALCLIPALGLGLLHWSDYTGLSLGFLRRGDSLLIARAANRFLGKADREAASVLSNAQRHTHFLDSPRITAALARSDLDFADLRRGIISVFLVLPPNRLDTHNRWLRLMVAQALQDIARDAERPQERATGLLRRPQRLRTALRRQQPPQAALRAPGRPPVALCSSCWTSLPPSAVWSLWSALWG